MHKHSPGDNNGFGGEDGLDPRPGRFIFYKK